MLPNLTKLVNSRIDFASTVSAAIAGFYVLTTRAIGP